ncbi:hypothetical protein K504DRAFT_465142 [Pleomassaria siparia CBS 279.74]|uniref:2EXR domain-containing protein n=1 Tax=Pleomassaria siparia CBS 279.74 TaxID=1314801 RepID=A0A6G1KEX6_9PLEO|nr:hypothetical protein K504DRAFT_465142 [Pleomassaria siparia CBS 279.74]
MIVGLRASMHLVIDAVTSKLKDYISHLVTLFCLGLIAVVVIIYLAFVVTVLVTILLPVLYIFTTICRCALRSVKLVLRGLAYAFPKTTTALLAFCNHRRRADHHYSSQRWRSASARLGRTNSSLKFERFLHLPLELQNMIWSFVYANNPYTLDPRPIHPRWIWTMHPVTLSASRNYFTSPTLYMPSIFNISHHARSEACWLARRLTFVGSRREWPSHFYQLLHHEPWGGPDGQEMRRDRVPLYVGLGEVEMSWFEWMTGVPRFYLAGL